MGVGGEGVTDFGDAAPKGSSQQSEPVCSA